MTKLFPGYKKASGRKPKHENAYQTTQLFRGSEVLRGAFWMLWARFSGYATRDVMAEARMSMFRSVTDCIWTQRGRGAVANVLVRLFIYKIKFSE